MKLMCSALFVFVNLNYIHGFAFCGKKLITSYFLSICELKPECLSVFFIV